MNFKNPWAKGGEYYPDWLGGEKVLSRKNLSHEPVRYETIELLERNSSIVGMTDYDFRFANNNNGWSVSEKDPILWVRYLDKFGNIAFEAPDFKFNTPEYFLAHAKAIVYRPNGHHIFPRIHQGVEREAWLYWEGGSGRYKLKGLPDNNVHNTRPDGTIEPRFKIQYVRPPSYSVFEVLFNTDKYEFNLESIINYADCESMLMSFTKFIIEGTNPGIPQVNGKLASNNVGVLVIGYHSPSTGSPIGNTSLAINRAKSIKEQFVKITSLPSSELKVSALFDKSGGEHTQSAFIIIGHQNVIDQLKVETIKPSLGE